MQVALDQMVDRKYCESNQHDSRLVEICNQSVDLCNTRQVELVTKSCAVIVQFMFLDSFEPWFVLYYELLQYRVGLGWINTLSGHPLKVLIHHSPTHCPFHSLLENTKEISTNKRE